MGEQAPGVGTPTTSHSTRVPDGFTLIELLVVISIIALLIAILLPALGAARASGRSAQSLSNVRQMGIAVAAYNHEYKGWFPKHEGWYNPPGRIEENQNTDGSQTFANGDLRRRTHWPDHLFVYISTPSIYLSPLLTAEEIGDFTTRFVFDPYFLDGVTRYGGYGWNYQYLGSDRRDALGLPFYARADRDAVSPSNTVAIGDTAGSRNGVASNRPGQNNQAVYVVDPPLGSIGLGSKGSRRVPNTPGNYYYANAGNAEEPNGTPETYLYRAFPALRNNGVANFVFVDGHGEGVKLDKVDDFDRDGVKDNGYWNSRGNPTMR